MRFMSEAKGRTRADRLRVLMYAVEKICFLLLFKGGKPLGVKIKTGSL